MREPFITLNNFQYLIQYLHSQIQRLHYTLNRIYHYDHYLSFVHILHCSIATLFYFIMTLLNYIQYSLHRIYYLSNLLHFSHLSIYILRYICYLSFHITAFSPYCYRGSVPCTGDVEPFILVQNGCHLFIVIFIYVFQYHFRHKYFQDFFPCFPFYSISLHLESNYPERFPLKVQCHFAYLRIQILLLGNLYLHHFEEG